MSGSPRPNDGRPSVATGLIAGGLALVMVPFILVSLLIGVALIMVGVGM